MTEKADREDEVVSPSGTIYFPHLRPVRLHLADHIAGSPSLWQVWNSGSQPRSDMLQRLDDYPEQLDAVLALLQNAADNLPLKVCNAARAPLMLLLLLVHEDAYSCFKCCP